MTTVDTTLAKAKALRIRPETIAYLQATHTTMNHREQAERLGLSPRTVACYRSRLYGAGLISREQRTRYRPITEAELAQAQELARQGLSRHQIAAALGRSEHSMSYLFDRSGRGWYDCRAEPDAPLVYNASQVAQLLGVWEMTVSKWITRGILVGTRTKDAETRTRGRRPKRGVTLGQFQVAHADLLDFLRQRDYWMAWEPERIPDPALRRAAETFRAERPGRWWRLAELADALHYSLAAVQRWQQAGWPGGYETTRWGRRLFIWIPQGSALPDVPAFGKRGWT
jgi:DNA-binding MarR family transcriptional regulator